MTKIAAFDTTLREAHEWLHAVGGELGTSDEKIGRAALRAALHVLRDSLTMVQAIELGDCLPVLVRGLYYEGWHPKRDGGGEAAPDDAMKSMEHDIRGHSELVPAEKTLRACFHAFDRLLPRDEVRVFLNVLPPSIQALWPGEARASEAQHLQDWRWK